MAALEDHVNMISPDRVELAPADRARAAGSPKHPSLMVSACRQLPGPPAQIAESALWVTVCDASAAARRTIRFDRELLGQEARAVLSIFSQWEERTDDGYAGRCVTSARYSRTAPYRGPRPGGNRWLRCGRVVRRAAKMRRTCVVCCLL
jgi:hypothetical protein